MARGNSRYNIYENDELVYENIENKDVFLIFGKKPTSGLNWYAEKHYKLFRKYDVRRADGDIFLDKEFKIQWEYMQSLFKNVIWVKEGGRRLKIGATKSATKSATKR